MTLYFSPKHAAAKLFCLPLGIAQSGKSLLGIDVLPDSIGGQWLGFNVYYHFFNIQ